MGYEMLDSQQGMWCRGGYNCLVSINCEWNNFCIEIAHKISGSKINFLISAPTGEQVQISGHQRAKCIITYGRWSFMRGGHS